MPEFINSAEFLYDNLLKTGQITCYAISDDGDRQKGQSKAYQVLTTGSQSGTVNIDSPHYAAATIAFAATTPGTITDSANLLATVLTGDKIRIRGSALNDNAGVEYNVSTGGVAGTIRTTEPTVAELAGAYITICKRATHSNAIVVDLRSDPRFGRRMWTQSVQTGKIGPASDGKLNWYHATKCYALRVADANMAMVAGNILRIEGIDESSRYFAGAVLVCSGFANAVNLLPCLVVKSVSFTGGNTDIVVDPGNQTLIAEVAGGSRAIKIVCQNIYGYCAAANEVLLGGYEDWRIPNRNEGGSILNYGNSRLVPDVGIFPDFPIDVMWASAVSKFDNTLAYTLIGPTDDYPGIPWLRTNNARIILVRGG